MTLPLHGFVDYQHAIDVSDKGFTQAIQTIGPGAVFDVPVFDLRSYTSYTLLVQAVGAPNANEFNRVVINMNWNPGNLPGTAYYRDSYEIFAQQTGNPGFVVPWIGLTIIDSVPMPFQNLQIVNGGIHNIDASWYMFGHSRPIDRRRVSQLNIQAFPPAEQDLGVVWRDFTNVAAGANIDAVFPLSPGPANIRILSATQPGTFQLLLPGGQIFDESAFAAGVEYRANINLPRAAVHVHLTNTGGAASNIRSEILSGRADW